MIRAGVFIGVDKTGNLPKLNDAAKGARRMYEWALAQGMDEMNARLITDEGGTKVSLDRIYTAVQEIVNGAGVDQLIIYFAGHGVYNNFSEKWLLSDAPLMTSAAVNVLGSVEIARYCGIKHVVFISDACRMAAAGIQALNVLGSEIFPNDPTTDGKVDQFFACSRGKTAIEYKDGTTASSTYTALFTTALLDALKGLRPEVLEPADEVGDPYQYIKPTKLENYLRSELPRRVKALGLQNKVSQDPDAIITVGGSWIARINQPVEPETQERGLATEVSQPTLTVNLTKSAVNGHMQAFHDQIEQARLESVQEIDKVATTAEMLTAPFGPDRFETHCGFKVRGARFTGVFAPGIFCELMKGDGNNLHVHSDDLRDLPQWGNNDILRIHTPEVNRGALTVLIRFEGGFGTVLPAIPGYITALTVDQDELIDVAYEPSTNTSLWHEFQEHADNIRTLRAIAASSSQHSRFSLDRNDALQIAQRMQYEKRNDPTLSIYAAYAYYDLQEIERIQEMNTFQRISLGFVFFDLALLGRMLRGKHVNPHPDDLDSPLINTGIVPFVPLLSQGWSLLNANRIALHPALANIEQNLRDSLWSLYDSAGLEKLKQAMQ